MARGHVMRGQVYMADLSNNGSGQKPWLIVSNNHRNKALESVLAVRITTTQKYLELDTVVELPSGEPVMGYVRCDELTEVWLDELGKCQGALSPATMSLVNAGLMAALAIE